MAKAGGYLSSEKTQSPTSFLKVVNRHVNKEDPAERALSVVWTESRDDG